MKTCFLIGHRDTGDEIYPALEDAIEAAIVEHGIQEFIVGHYGRFDRMAARALVTAKSKHREIKLTLGSVHKLFIHNACLNPPLLRCRRSTCPGTPPSSTLYGCAHALH